MEQIIHIFDVVFEDVKNRNGLGKELLVSTNGEREELTKSIRVSISEVIEKVLVQNNMNEEKSAVISRWLCLIFTDSIFRREPLSAYEWSLITDYIM